MSQNTTGKTKPDSTMDDKTTSETSSNLGTTLTNQSNLSTLQQSNIQERQYGGPSNNFNIDDDSDDDMSEDSQGEHRNSEFGCRGCESGVDNPGAHCSACNRNRGFRGGTLSEERKLEYRRKLNQEIMKIAYQRGTYYGPGHQEKNKYKNWQSIQRYHDTCVCNICEFSKTLYSKDLLNFCKNFSNDDSLGEINLEPFFSRYKTKDFLSLHTDAVTNFDSKEKRKLAVVIHLTKDWKPWYGGNLMVLNKESSFIKKALTPKFNSVTLMKVQEEGTPHYVDPLIFGNFDKNRYAISMWY